MQLQPIELRHPPYDYTSAFSTATATRVEAVLPLTSPVFFLERARLLERLETHRLPAIHHQREFAVAGGLMAYGASIAEGISPRCRLCRPYPARRQAGPTCPWNSP